MKSESLLNAFGQINEEYIIEAAPKNIREKTKAGKKNKWISWGLMAACAVGIIGITAPMISQHQFFEPGSNGSSIESVLLPEEIIPTPEEIIPELIPEQTQAVTPPSSSSDNPVNELQASKESLIINPVESIESNVQEECLESCVEVSLNLKDIHMNDLSAALEIDNALKAYEPELYDTIIWNTNDILNYYGKDLTPAYIPENLIASPSNGTASIIISKNDEMTVDMVWYGFYHAYDEKGYPQPAEGIPAKKGFSLKASKIGLIKDCIYVLPEDTKEISYFKNTESGREEVGISFGYRLMPYGPYDAQTKAPSGYYDLYVAEFEYEGIEYELIAEQMELKEFIKVVASIIYETDEITFDS